MQSQQDVATQAPDKLITREVFVGYGAGSPGPNSWWKNWLAKIRAVVWPPLASPVRRLVTVGVGVIFVATTMLSIALVSNDTARELITGTNGGQQIGEDEGQGGAADPDDETGNPEEEGADQAGSEDGDESNGQDGDGSNSGSGSNGDVSGSGGSNGGGSSGGGEQPGGGGEGPASCEWPNFPNETCTGVPAGVTLTPSGSLNITTAGTVIDAMLITGTVEVRAPNVVIKRSKILPGNFFAVRVHPGGSVLVEDVEMDGQQPEGGVVSSPAVPVGFGNYTLRRVNIHSFYEGPRMGSNVTIEDSYIHHMSRCTLTGGDSCHIDTLQSTAGSNITIRHNTLLPYNDVTDDPQNAAAIIKADTGNIDNVLVEKNYMNGGNYTIYVETASFTTSNVTVRDNHFGRDYRFGIKSIEDVVGFTWENNVWADTGEIIP